MIKRYTQPCVQTQPGLEFRVAEVELFEDAKGKWVRFEDIKHLLPEQQSEGWHPIETAPKGGVWVLLWWPTVTDVPFVGYRVGEKWHAATNGDTWIGPGPTHWQSLPEGPTA